MSAFQIKKSSDGEFFFRLKGNNGETILASEMYKSHASALGGIESVKKNASHPERYEKKKSVKNQHYFVLHAANRQIVGTSEMYDTEAACDSGIASVKANAPAAKIDDQAAAAEVVTAHASKGSCHGCS